MATLAQAIAGTAIYHIPFEGPAKIIEPANGKHFTLEEMQTAVGGLIEFMEMDPERGIVICNEEAKLRDDWTDRINRRATAILGPEFANWDVIAGDVIYVPAARKRVIR